MYILYIIISIFLQNQKNLHCISHSFIHAVSAERFKDDENLHENFLRNGMNSPKRRLFSYFTRRRKYGKIRRYWEKINA